MQKNYSIASDGFSAFCHRAVSAFPQFEFLKYSSTTYKTYIAIDIRPFPRINVVVQSADTVFLDVEWQIAIFNVISGLFQQLDSIVLKLFG